MDPEITQDLYDRISSAFGLVAVRGRNKSIRVAPIDNCDHTNDTYITFPLYSVEVAEPRLWSDVLSRTLAKESFEISTCSSKWPYSIVVRRPVGRARMSRCSTPDRQGHRAYTEPPTNTHSDTASLGWVRRRPTPAPPETFDRRGGEPTKAPLGGQQQGSSTHVPRTVSVHCFVAAITCFASALLTLVAMSLLGWDVCPECYSVPVRVFAGVYGTAISFISAGGGMARTALAVSFISVSALAVHAFAVSV